MWWRWILRKSFCWIQSRLDSHLIRHRSFLKNQSSVQSIHTQQTVKILLSAVIGNYRDWNIYHFKVDLLPTMCDVDEICSLATNLYNYTWGMGSSGAKVNIWIYVKQIYALCVILVHCIYCVHCNISKVKYFPKGFYPRVGRLFYIPRHRFCLSNIRYSHEMITCPFMLVEVHIIIMVSHLK